MAAGGATRGVDRKSTHNITYEELVPSSGWTEDSNCHCLLIDLPGFKKEQVKLQVDNDGNVIASGERKVTENKRIRFQQSYKVPEDSKTEETTAKFEDEILYVIIPKQETMQKNTENQIGTVSNDQQQIAENTPRQENINYKDDDKDVSDHKMRDDEKFHDAATQWNAGNLLETMKEKLKKNKGIIVTALLAFSFGVIVSHKFQSQGE